MLALCVCKILCEGLSDALRVVVRYVLLLCDMRPKRASNCGA